MYRREGNMSGWEKRGKGIYPGAKTTGGGMSGWQKWWEDPESEWQEFPKLKRLDVLVNPEYGLRFRFKWHIHLITPQKVPLQKQK